MKQNNLSRRDFIKRSGFAAAGVMAASSFNLSLKRTPGNTPNIIYILADDLGYADLSCYGQRKFKTPNIDKLANEGMSFTQHYAGSTVCAPSRCTLITGLHTGHCKIRDNFSHINKR